MDLGNGSYSFRQVSQIAKPELSVSTARIQIKSIVVLSDGLEIADAREINSSLLHTEELNHFLRPHTSCKRMLQMVSVFPINPDNRKKFAAYIASNLVRVAPLANTGSFQVEFEVSAKHHERTLHFEGEEEIMDCEEEEEIMDSEEEEEEITDCEEEEEIVDLVPEESLESAQQNSLAPPPLTSPLQEPKSRCKN